MVKIYPNKIYSLTDSSSYYYVFQGFTAQLWSFNFKLYFFEVFKRWKNWSRSIIVFDFSIDGAFPDTACSTIPEGKKKCLIPWQTKNLEKY